MVAAQQAGPRSSALFDLDAGAEPFVKPPPRLIVIGEPGIGKTTFLASAPNVVLIPTEKGSLGVNVRRLPLRGKCETWQDVLNAWRGVLRAKQKPDWAGMDTLNGAVELCAAYICHRDFGGVWVSAKDTEGFNAFGKGEKAVAQELRELLALMDEVQDRGIGIILTAHVGLHKQGNALGADFLKFAAEMPKPAWALLCAWADQVAHGCRELRASVREGERKAKASAIGNERWLVFEGGPGRDAKARVGYEMPEKILLSWEEYERHLSADKVAPLVEQAIELCAKAPAEIQEKLAKRFEGDVTPEKLRALGKTKLETLIGWLLAWSRKEQE